MSTIIATLRTRPCLIIRHIIRRQRHIVENLFAHLRGIPLKINRIQIRAPPKRSVRDRIHTRWYRNRLQCKAVAKCTLPYLLYRISYLHRRKILTILKCIRTNPRHPGLHNYLLNLIPVSSPWCRRRSRIIFHIAASRHRQRSTRLIPAIICLFLPLPGLHLIRAYCSGIGVEIGR